MNLTVVVLTKNEKKNIKECLDSLNFCDETIVVDDNSSDGTTDLAKKLGAKVYERKLGKNFAAQRNFGLDKARGKWVLFIDADERVTENLRNEIVQITNDPLVNYLGFYFKRTDYMWGKKLKHGETANIKLLRLARRKAGKWKRKVHEVWEVGGRTRELKNTLMHYPHPTLADFLTSVNIMSGLHARANLEEGKNSSLIKIIVWPPGHFIYNYI
ncbi:glycosyltransferase family 2 protein, partial [Patescibacteria group bacterium]|nr:glycosyltransferase family 2 protein [Patescibacteria group bacterium]